MPQPWFPKLTRLEIVRKLLAEAAAQDDQATAAASIKPGTCITAR